MPLTIAHPAIILPVLRYSRNAAFVTGLFIGCLTPDFEYFLCAQLTSTISHTVLGQFIFCLPVGIILTLLWQVVIKKPLLANMPQWFRMRLSSVHSSHINGFNQWLFCCLGLIFGSFSHIIWDSFTHESGYFVKLMPLLGNSQLGSIPVYKFAQHFSTAIGLMALGLYLFWLQPTPEVSAEPTPWKYWFPLAFFFITTFLLLWYLIPDQGHRHSIGNKIVWLHTAGIVSLVLAGFTRLRYGS